MPGLAGCIDLRQPTASGVVGRMLEQAWPSHRRHQVKGGGDATMGHAAHASQLEQGGVLHRDTVVLAISGTYAGTSREGDLTEAALEIYLHEGPEALVAQNGIYAIAVWDASRRRLFLAQDSLGLGQLVYAASGTRIVFATDPAALVTTLSPSLDPLALGDLLTVGHPAGNRTLFAGVQTLGPGSLLEWQDGQLETRRLRAPLATGQNRATCTFDDAVEALDTGIAQAVEDALHSTSSGVLHEPCAIPLSGGLDSRTLLGYARRHTSPLTLTYGHAHCRDRRYGARLARRAGTEHRAIELSPAYMAEHGAALVRTTAGTASIHNAHLFALTEHLPPQGAVLSGLLGDIYTGSHFKIAGTLPDDPALALRAHGEQFFERAYRVGFTEGELPALLRPSFRDACQGSAKAEFLATYDAAPDPITAADWVRLERQRRFTRYQLDVLGQVAVVRSPLCDQRVSEVCLAFPPEFRWGQLVFREVIRRAHPDLAAVPVTSSRIPVGGSRLKRALRRQLEETRWLRLPRWSRGHLRPHDYRQYAHYDRWIRTHNAAYFRELCAPGTLLDEVIDTRVVGALLDAHLDGRVDAYQKLCAVATVAQWVDTFMGAVVSAASTASKAS